MFRMFKIYLISMQINSHDRKFLFFLYCASNLKFAYVNAYKMSSIVIWCFINICSVTNFITQKPETNKEPLNTENILENNYNVKQRIIREYICKNLRNELYGKLQKELVFWISKPLSMSVTPNSTIIPWDVSVNEWVAIRK